MTIYKSEKGQAMPGPVQPISPEDFEPTGRTELRWLGGGGIMLNCRGTVLRLTPCWRASICPAALLGNR